MSYSSDVAKSYFITYNAHMSWLFLLIVCRAVMLPWKIDDFLSENLLLNVEY